MLILHGTEDVVAPVEVSRRLYAAANAPKVLSLVRGAGHADLQQVGGAE